MHQLRSLTTKMLGLIAIAAAYAAALGAAESFAVHIAQLSVSAGVLTWTPVSGDNPLSLTVSSDEIYLRQKFDVGKAPFLRRETPDGGLLPDGLYTWELRAIPSEAPPSADRENSLSLENGRFTRRPNRRPLVQSGTFQVVGGAFVGRKENLE